MVLSGSESPSSEYVLMSFDSNHGEYRGGDALGKYAKAKMLPAAVRSPKATGRIHLPFFFPLRRRAADALKPRKIQAYASTTHQDSRALRLASRVRRLRAF